MKKLSLLLLIITLSLGAMAQNQPERKEQGRHQRFDKEEFRQRMQDFITREANLTENEAKAFFPIFNEYKNEQRKINMSIHALKRKTGNSSEKPNYEERLMKIAKLNGELAALDSVYYKKLCKVISAEKLFKILIIEDRMHRQMLQNYNRGNDRPEGEGRGPRGNGPRGEHRK